MTVTRALRAATLLVPPLKAKRQADITVDILNVPFNLNLSVLLVYRGNNDN